MKKNHLKGVVAIATGILFGNVISVSAAQNIIENKTIEVNNTTSSVQVSSSDYQIKYDYRIFYEGNEITLENGVLIYTDSTGVTSTYLPFRELGNILGASVNWFADYKTAELVLNNTELEVISSKTSAVVIQDGEVSVVNVQSATGSVIPIINANGYNYLPIRFITENLGYNITYTQQHAQTGTKTIEIYSSTTAPALNLEDTSDTSTEETTTQETTTDTTSDTEETTSETTSTTSIPAGVKAGTEEQWQKFFSQTDAVYGTTAVANLYYTTSIEYVPVFDINQDGYIGGYNISGTEKKVTYAEFQNLSNEDKVRYVNLEYQNAIYKTLPSAPTYTGTDGEISTDNYWKWSTVENKWIINGKYVKPLYEDLQRRCHSNEYTISR